MNPPKATKAGLEKERLRQLSVDRANKWPNTLEVIWSLSLSLRMLLEPPRRNPSTARPGVDGAFTTTRRGTRTQAARERKNKQRLERLDQQEAERCEVRAVRQHLPGKALLSTRALASVAAGPAEFNSAIRALVRRVLQGALPSGVAAARRVTRVVFRSYSRRLSSIRRLILTACLMFAKYHELSGSHVLMRSRCDARVWAERHADRSAGGAHQGGEPATADRARQ